MELLWRSNVFHANCFPNENVQSHGPFPSSTCFGADLGIPHVDESSHAVFPFPFVFSMGVRVGH